MKKPIIFLFLLFSFLCLYVATNEKGTASEPSGYGHSQVINVVDFGANGSDKVDDTQAIQQAITYAMTNGGGTVYLPAGDYLIEGTLYTHRDSYDENDTLSPLEIKGETPVSGDLYNAKRKHVTRLIKKNEGVILAVNYTTTKESATPSASVYRNLSVRNLAFYGSGETDATYPKVFAKVKNTIGIDMHNAAITLEDSIFWTLSKGVAQPEKVNGFDNYCDQSVYRRLAFYNIGHTWLELQRSDATTIEQINGYDMAKTTKYGIYARKGESFSINEVLVAGKAMHLAKDFTLISLQHTNNTNIQNVYAERVEGTLIKLDHTTNVSINGLSVRHYGNTYIKGWSARNVAIQNVLVHIEEGKRLSSTDPGNYSEYENIPFFQDFTFDRDSSNISFRSTVFQHGIHTPGVPFTVLSERTSPRMDKIGLNIQSNESYEGIVYYEPEQQKLVAKVNGRIVNLDQWLGSSVVYNQDSGILKFTKSGVLSNYPTVSLTNGVSINGITNYAAVLTNDPLTLQLVDREGKTISLQNVKVLVNIQY